MQCWNIQEQPYSVRTRPSCTLSETGLHIKQGGLSMIPITNTEQKKSCWSLSDPTGPLRGVMSQQTMVVENRGHYRFLKNGDSPQPHGIRRNFYKVSCPTTLQGLRLNPQPSDCYTTTLPTASRQVDQMSCRGQLRVWWLRAANCVIKETTTSLLLLFYDEHNLRLNHLGKTNWQFCLFMRYRWVTSAWCNALAVGLKLCIKQLQSTSFWSHCYAIKWYVRSNVVMI